MRTTPHEKMILMESAKLPGRDKVQRGVRILANEKIFTQQILINIATFYCLLAVLKIVFQNSFQNYFENRIVFSKKFF